MLEEESKRLYLDGQSTGLSHWKLGVQVLSISNPSYQTCMQVSAASASGCPADLDTISEELFRQLSSGQTVNLAAVLSRARDRSQSHSPADTQAGGHAPGLPSTCSST